jgi:hypothetical protein
MGSIPIYNFPNHSLIRGAMFRCLFLEKFNARFFQSNRYLNVLLFQDQLVWWGEKILNDSQELCSAQRQRELVPSSGAFQEILLRKTG